MSKPRLERSVWITVKLTIAITTYSSYCNMVKNIIVPYFRERGVTLSGLKPTDIQTFYTEQLKRVKANSVIHYLPAILCEEYQNMKTSELADLVKGRIAEKIAERTEA